MVSNFIPELWSARINEALRKALVYAALCNRDYEGQIQQAGDTVHITSFDDPTVSDYTPESNINVQSIDDDTLALNIDQKKYFAFDVDDVNRKQALAGWVESVTSRGAYKMADAIDQFVAGVLFAAAHNTVNDLGDRTADISDNTAYGIIVDLGTLLDESNVPSDGRWVVVPPVMYGALLQDNRFINAQASADGGQALHNGRVGSIVGFDVYKSNNVPNASTGIHNVVAGHPMAATFAQQLLELEAQRRELRFGDLVKGLEVYGAKAIRPEALATAAVTVQA
jgi:N4-gp56 family major capsid protein